MAEKSPILNNPYREPGKHYATDPEGQLDYNDVREGRRFFTPEMGGIPSRHKGQKNAFEINDLESKYEAHLVNLLRKEVKQWRKEGYQGVTRVSKELLDFWFNNPERDTSHELDVPKLRNLYDHVKEKLPSKGQKKKKSEARKAGESVNQDQPNIPELVELALDQFYNHYREEFVRPMFMNPTEKFGSTKYVSGYSTNMSPGILLK